MGYYDHKWRVSFVLDDLGERGLPVDRQRQDDLREYIGEQEVKLSAELQALIPEELLPVHPKVGYKALPKDLRAALKAADAIMPKTAPLAYMERNEQICRELSYAVREFDIDGVIERRLCKVLPFNANSSAQLQQYINHRGYRQPLHIDTGLPTTGKEAIETLIAETDDDVMRQIQKMRKLGKMRTYCSGSWVPGEDGRVHPKFAHRTASGQTVAFDPNIQQYPEHYDDKDEWMSELYHLVKGCIRAEPGHVFVKTDLRAFHARMQGWMSEDPAYYRMANFDPHSYVTAYYVGEPDAHTLMSLSDEELRPRLKEIKAAHTHERNAKVKRTLFLMQFGGGADKMFRILNGGGFTSLAEVEALMNLIRDLFPKTFKDFPKQTRRMLSRDITIRSQFNCIRQFWDHDAEQGTAFRVSNPAHCHVQERLWNLYRAGAFKRFNAINFAHDALWNMPWIEDADECRRVVTEEFERPSDVLVNSLGAFTVRADTQVGDDMTLMEDV